MSGALHGVRVLDLSRVLAGPFCTMVLGDFGADVIKVEQPERGDDTRSWGPPFAGSESAYYASVNRNKRSIAVDFRTETGRQIIRDLAQRSDVVVENFRPGTLARFRLGYEDLREINPRLIYCSISAFGSSGPDHERPGLDVIVAAVGGLMSITGEEHGPPVKTGVALIDITTALYAVSSITAALLARQQSGCGQKIELSLLGVELATLVNIAGSYLIAGEVPRRWGSAHPSIVPYQAFQAADGHVVIGATNDVLWQKFCRAAGLDRLADDPRLATNAGRVLHREEVVDAIQAIAINKTRAEWLALCRDAGVPCGPVKTLDEVYEDPQVQHLGLVQSIAHPTIGRMPVTASPVQFSRTPTTIRRHPPLLGEHSDEIMRDVLGYSADQIAAHRRQY